MLCDSLGDWVAITENKERGYKQDMRKRKARKFNYGTVTQLD